MVNLLTDYTTQIYHALSTDARPTGETGSQLWEIDTGKRFIFDGTSWNELPDGGGGGGGYTLLQSGTYTLASNTTTSMLIPIVTDKPFSIVTVERETLSTNAAESYAWLTLRAPSSITAYFSVIENARRMARRNSSGTISVSGDTESHSVVTDWANDNITRFYCVPYNSSFPIRAGTFKWYVWGGENE